jgi:hypothetical protein
MRRDFTGEFVTQDLGGDTWRLTRSEPSRMDIYLRHARLEAADALTNTTVSEVTIEWRSDAVRLTLTSRARPRSITAQSAIIHEPLPRLYDALPLASFDDKAARFWRRVFRLVRIPGGRHLLKLVARRSRGPR